MASSSSQTSPDHNPWISARRLFRSLQHSRISASFRRKRFSDKSAPPPGDRSGAVLGAWSQSPFQSNDRISSVSNVGILPELSPPSATDEDRRGIECPICTQFLPLGSFFSFQTCQHRSCLTCLKIYVQVEVTEGRVEISCPECPEKLHPGDIRVILNDDQLMQKYEEFLLRRALVLDPDTRWCPAPDCSYAVIASGCASCPQLSCERPGCGTLFCYHCKQRWHPNQTCDAARAERDDANFPFPSDLNNDQTKQSMIKCCPRCGSMIMKLDDGSCNHMTCAGCGAEFCWLCLKEISDLHYLSPSGCTFWGKKPWTRKRKILWQLGMLIGAPIGISLIAGISFPVIIIGLPIFVGRKLLAKCRHMAKRKRHLVVASGVIASTLVSPVLAAIAVGAGVPMLLAYVYGVVPVSLCRDSCCSGRRHRSEHPSEFEFDIKNIQEDQTGSPVLIAATAPVGETSSKPLSSENSSVQNQSHSSKVEVVAEVSCDLASHAADGELKENLDNSAGKDRNSTSIYTNTAAYSGSANISDSRELGNNNKAGASVSDAALNGSLPGAYSFSSDAVAECAGASSSSSSESVHPRLSSFHRHETRLFPESSSSHGSSVACHVRPSKRQSMSVGDSIDEKVEAECGCLSLHSLAEEENCLESFAGGSDIVTMVAIEENPSDSQGKMRPIQSLKSMAGALVAEANSSHRSGKSSDVVNMGADVVLAEKEQLSCCPRVLLAEDLSS